MEIKDIQRNEKKTVRINLLIFPSVDKWLRDNNISPTALFDTAVKELMEKEK